MWTPEHDRLGLCPALALGGLGDTGPGRIAFPPALLPSAANDDHLLPHGGGGGGGGGEKVPVKNKV